MTIRQLSDNEIEANRQRLREVELGCREMEAKTASRWSKLAPLVLLLAIFVGGFLIWYNIYTSDPSRWIDICKEAADVGQCLVEVRR